MGITHEAMIDRDKVGPYQDAAERVKLSARVRPLIRMGKELTADRLSGLLSCLPS